MKHAKSSGARSVYTPAICGICKTYIRSIQKPRATGFGAGMIPPGTGETSPLQLRSGVPKFLTSKKWEIYHHKIVDFSMYKEFNNKQIIVVSTSIFIIDVAIIFFKSSILFIFIYANLVSQVSVEMYILVQNSIDVNVNLRDKINFESYMYQKDKS